MSKLLDIKLKNLPTKWDVEGLKQELKSDIEAISLQVKQLTDDNARLKEEVISLRSDRETAKRTINMLLEEQKKKCSCKRGEGGKKLQVGCKNSD